MEAFQKRLDSFKPKKVKHGSKNVTLKWPHPEHFKANAQSLAEAGFYFDPSFDDKDAVKCFMCGKMLSEWEEDDDPFDIHWSKCAKTCAWANVRCGLREDMDEDGGFVFVDKSRIPTSKAMEKARLATFTSGDWWPHDATDGHGAASTSMARAGFVYTPQFPADDLVTCLYCQISLSGWDEDDDPMEEHRKRNCKSTTPCPFFPSTGSSKPSSRASSKPRSKATASKAHKPKAPSRSETVENIEEEDDETQVAVMKGAKTPRKPRRTASSTAKTPGTLKRTKSKRVVAEEEDEESEAEEPLKPAAVKPSKSRAKLKQVYEDVEEEVAEEPEEPKPRTTRRQSTRTRSKSRAPADEDEVEVDPLDVPKRQKKATTKPTPQISDSEAPPVAESSRPPSARTASKSRAKAPSPDEDEAFESQPPRRQPPSRPTNGHTRKPSRSQSKAMIISEPEQAEEAPAPAPPKKSSRTKATPAPEPIQQDADEESVSPIPTATKSKGKSKAPKSVPKVKEPRQQPKAPATQQLDEDEPEDPQSAYEDAMEVIDEPEPSPDMGQPDDSDPVSSRPVSPTIAQKLPSVHLELKREDKDPRRAKASPEPPVLKIGPPKSLKPKKSAPSSRAAPPSSTSSSTSQRPPVSTTSSTSLRKPSHIVEILSDDDVEDSPTVPPPPVLTATKPKASVAAKAQKLVMEVVLPLPPKKAQSPVADVQMVDDRVIAAKSDMRPDMEEDIMPRIVSFIPQTPPRPAVPLEDNMNGSPEPDTTTDAPLPPLPSFHPPLSTMPFQQLDQLTEAELDMTVEEWIRYQMSIEYGKFKRDGEREINRFKERAEEVRRAIATL